MKKLKKQMMKRCIEVDANNAHDIQVYHGYDFSTDKKIKLFYQWKNSQDKNFIKDVFIEYFGEEEYSEYIQEYGTNKDKLKDQFSNLSKKEINKIMKFINFNKLKVDFNYMLDYCHLYNSEKDLLSGYNDALENKESLYTIKDFLHGHHLWDIAIKINKNKYILFENYKDLFVDINC